MRHANYILTQHDGSVNTVDYQARHHEIDFVLSPYYGAGNLSFLDAQKTLALKYRKTILHIDRNNTKTSGLDALGIREAQIGYPRNPYADPQVPVANASYQHLSVDAEGLVENADGRYVSVLPMGLVPIAQCHFFCRSIWVSDEYGPYIYRFSSSGHLIQTIQPPAAILPHDSTGALNFTSATDPTTGRTGNQGTYILFSIGIRSDVYPIL